LAISLLDNLPVSGLGSFEVLMIRDCDFEIAGAEVTNLGHVPSEPRLQGDAARVGLEVDEQHLRLRVDLNASKFLDPAEGMVRPSGLGDVVAKRQQVCL